MTDTQRQIARKLVELLTKTHYIISVWVDKDYTIKQSYDVDDILAAMGTRHMDTIEIDKPPSTEHNSQYLGSIDLIYHNETIVISGDDVRPALKPIIDQAMEFAANLTAETTS